MGRVRWTPGPKATTTPATMPLERRQGTQERFYERKGIIPAMIREYFPLAAVVAVMFAGWMLTAYYAPTQAVLAFGVFASAFVALGVGGLTAWALWHGAT